MIPVNALISIGLFVLAVYLGYLIVTRAFKEMGFSAVEAIIIIFISFLFGEGLLDGIGGITFSNIPVFTYHAYWQVGINVGGAIIPVVLSIYLIIKNKLQAVKIFLGIILVSLVTYLVTTPDPKRGIIAQFPYWLLPIIIASLFSIFLYWKQKRKAAPLAYAIGTIGVLLGADCFHLITLLNYEIEAKTPAVIGGASVFDMVFITGILAVFIDGVLLYHAKR